MGLLEEAHWLYKQNIPNSQAALGIGYKELTAYFNGKINLEEAQKQIQQNSRRYAKRQLTWFRNRWAVVEWWDLIKNPNQKATLIETIKTFLSNQK